MVALSAPCSPLVSSGDKLLATLAARAALRGYAMEATPTGYALTRWGERWLFDEVDAVGQWLASLAYSEAP